MKTGNWTETDVAKLEAYVPGDMDSVKKLAEDLGRSPKSVIGKLVSEKMYVAVPKPEPKKKDEGPTKGEILSAIEAAGYSTKGLEPATKQALKNLQAFVAKHA